MKINHLKINIKKFSAAVLGTDYYYWRLWWRLYSWD